jgi:hypothetical protein
MSVLDGWQAIGQHIAAISGIARSERTLRRWAARRVDPLPVRRTPGGRDVYAHPRDVDEWWRRCGQQSGVGDST